LQRPIKSGISIAFATLGSSLITGNATAQEAGSVLEEIVVTSQRREERLSDVL
jgi:hypothetical protein